MAESQPVAATQHVVGVGDVPGDDLDPQVDERTGVGPVPGQGPDGVAPLEQELADVGPGQPGGAGDEDGLAHPSGCPTSAVSAIGRVHLVRVEGDDRGVGPEGVERVDEPVGAHGGGAGEAQLDDLGRGEDLAESAVGLVVDGVVVGRQEVEELDGQPLLVGEVRRRRANQAGHVLVGDRVVLAGLHAGLALAQLGAPDPDELEDPSTEEAVAPQALRAMLVWMIWAVR